MSSSIRTPVDVSLETLAKSMIDAQSKINYLTEKIIDPGKERFRNETEASGKGFTTEVPGFGKVSTAVGSAAQVVESWELKVDALSEPERADLIRRGILKKIVTAKKPGIPRVTITPNV